jgi:hypothetical protein
MAVYFANEKCRPYVKILPSTLSTNCQPMSTDIGSFVIESGGKGTLFGSTGVLDLFGEDAVGRVIGILAYVQSSNSSDFIGVQPICFDEDLLVIDYSTVYAGSTANAIVSTNVGNYFKLCKTTGSTTYGTPTLQAVLAKYLDPSTMATSVNSTAGFNFMLKDFNATARKAYVSVARKASTAVGIYV